MINQINMKRTLLGLGAGAIVAVGLIMSTTPAAADKLGVGITPYGFSLHYNSSPYYGKRNNYGYRKPYYGRRHNKRRRLNNQYYYNNSYNGYNSYQSGPGYANQGCQATSKTGYWQGRQAKIGGTMCYDAYGNSYVVQGSRYLIHYY